MAKRYDALTVRDYESGGEKKSRWTRIGVGFVSERDGSIKVILDANPIDGVIHLREPKPREDAKPGSDDLPF
jgi:hypothetical protein